MVIIALGELLVITGLAIYIRKMRPKNNAEASQQAKWEAACDEAKGKMFIHSGDGIHIVYLGDDVGPMDHNEYRWPTFKPASTGVMVFATGDKLQCTGTIVDLRNLAREFDREIVTVNNWMFAPFEINIHSYMVHALTLDQARERCEKFASPAVCAKRAQRVEALKPGDRTNGTPSLTLIAG